MVGSDTLAGTLVALAALMDIGTIQDTAAPVTAVYQCVNLGQDSLTIREVKTSCGCTVCDVPKQPIAPGDTVSLKLSFNPDNQLGTVDVKATVYSDAAPLTLRLTGTVVEADPYAHYRTAMGGLRLRTATVRLNGQVPQVERIACVNTTDAPIEVKAASCPKGISLQTEPAIIPPHAEADLIISIQQKPTRLPASITLDGTDGGKIMIVAPKASPQPSPKEREI